MYSIPFTVQYIEQLTDFIQSFSQFVAIKISTAVSVKFRKDSLKLKPGLYKLKT